jgi:surface antigen
VALALAGYCGGCSYRMGGPQTSGTGSLDDVTGSITPVSKTDDAPADSDLAFTRNAASDVLTRGDKNASQPWENPQTGARGSVTPLASAYTADDGRMCRDFLASYVKGETESWLEGEACKEGAGRWEVRALRPWRRSS